VAGHPFPRLGLTNRSGSSSQEEARGEMAGHVGHSDMRSGGLRASIFGVSDGLVSNVSLVLGTSRAPPGGGFVRLAGLAGLFGGSFSMTAGEYVSMRAQREVFEHQLDLERGELEGLPESERLELERIYVRRGVSPKVVATFARELMADPQTALDTHAREELGIDPNALGSPIKAGLASFLTFGVAAFVPLAAFLGGSSGSRTLFISIGCAGGLALVVGAVLSIFTARPWYWSALRSLLICAVAGPSPTRLARPSVRRDRTTPTVHAGAYLDDRYESPTLRCSPLAATLGHAAPLGHKERLAPGSALGRVRIGTSGHQLVVAPSREIEPDSG
jgi:VIT1/CCC1 family predicted Fe2+/Mn2+ transporter